MKRVVLALAALGILSVSSVMAAPVSYQSVLTGKVASTVSVGASVTEGQTLVTVETLAGPMAAAKSTVTVLYRRLMLQWVQTFLVIKSLSP